MPLHVPQVRGARATDAEAWGLLVGGGKEGPKSSGTWAGWCYLYVAGKTGQEAAGLGDT